MIAVTRREFVALMSAAAAAFSFPASAKASFGTKNIRPHPRLITSDVDIVRIKQMLLTDSYATGLYGQIKHAADTILNQDLIDYTPSGGSILWPVRHCMDRIYTLCAMWRIDGTRSYADRALRELRKAASLDNWNPLKSFLDTAEMTHTVAIGYDWLYPVLGQEDRELFQQAIVSKGIDPCLAYYDSKFKGWKISPYNWNIVCNSGIGIGALAVMDIAPDKSKQFFAYAMPSLQIAMATFAPDGGWPEGHAYWNYATRYLIAFITSLLSATGNDSNLSGEPGISQTGDFHGWMIGPCGTFNFADAGVHGELTSPAMFWLAQRFQRPEYIQWEKTIIEGEVRQHNPLPAQYLLWYPGTISSGKEQAPSLRKVFTGVNVGFLRSSWDNQEAFYVGAKGGINSTPHSHLDLGSFVFDAGGVRWSMSLGAEEYKLPGYFGPQRFDYYRTRTESKSTVLFNGQNQDINATANVTEYEDGLEINLDHANPELLLSWIRRLRLVNGKALLVEDYFHARVPVNALWGMITDSTVKLGGRRAILSKNGKQLLAEILSPDPASFSTVSTQAPAPQNSNKGTTKLVVVPEGQLDQARIAVRLSLMAS